MAEANIRKMCGLAKGFFEDALDRELIDRNPFKHRQVPTAKTGNKARQYFITREQAEKVLNACPDAEWRLLFALCRYGGLRNPSETLRLCWDDIDRERGRFVVNASKTEHHEGNGVRIVPISPELLPYLEAVYDEAPEGTRHVIARHRKANHRTLLVKIIKRAGLVPWPKPFHNLRATRQTERQEHYPQHVVCRWCETTRMSPGSTTCR
jgi:integrase